MDKKSSNRFWAKVNKNGPIQPHVPHLGKCWNWSAAKLACGYGVFSKTFGTTYAHRISWAIKNGDIPIEMQILHRCDNRACVNPEHLFIGSNQDNVDDKIAKGRNHHQQGDKWGDFIKSVQPRGEKSACAKLSNEQVLEIRKGYVKRSAQFGTTALAKKFGIPCSHVWSIVNRKAWVHI